MTSRNLDALHRAAYRSTRACRCRLCRPWQGVLLDVVLGLLTFAAVVACFLVHWAVRG